MIITQSQINLKSTHDLDIRHQKLVIRRTTPRQTALTAIPGANDPPSRNSEIILPTGRDKVDINIFQITGEQYTVESSGTYSPSAISAPPQDGDSSEQRTKLKILLKTLEKMTGKTYHFSDTGVQIPDTAASPDSGSQSLEGTPAEGPPGSGDTPPPPGNNTPRQVETITATRHYEREVSTFEAAGKIMTADGREIDINVELNMSRKFYEANVSRTLETRPLTDPLVIRLDSAGLELTDTKFTFDLNSDGVGETISFVTSETGGFLAFDRNKDGVINNGGELFGPSMGNGFSELSQFDEDKNGWIDEQDRIFYDLSIWSKTSDGKDHLLGVADTGIGAIYLNAADTPFSVTTSTNEKLGQIQRSSLYLNENGSAGVIQQVDLVS